MTPSIIYDFETLGTDPKNSVVLSVAALVYDEERLLNNPYTFEELLSETKEIKFSVADQVKNHRMRIDPNTMAWWKKQSDEARRVLEPSLDDKPLSDIVEFFSGFNPGNMKKVYTRGNTFDPIFLGEIYKRLKVPDPFKWWCIRDTRSMIDGLAFGSGISDKFVPPEYKAIFIAHNAKHDIVIDVIRMQTLVQKLFGDD